MILKKYINIKQLNVNIVGKVIVNSTINYKSPPIKEIVNNLGDYSYYLNTPITYTFNPPELKE